MSLPPTTPPRTPTSPGPDAEAQQDTRVLSRPLGAPPPRPLVTSRPAPPISPIPRAPPPPRSPAPGQPGGPGLGTAQPLNALKPPPSGAPPPRPQAPLAPPPGGPPAGTPSPRSPAPVSTSPAPTGLEVGKGRAPPKPGGGDAPAVKPGGKPVPTVPPPGTVPHVEPAEAKLPAEGQAPMVTVKPTPQLPMTGPRGPPTPARPIPPQPVEATAQAGMALPAPKTPPTPSKAPSTPQQQPQAALKPTIPQPAAATPSPQTTPPPAGVAKSPVPTQQQPKTPPPSGAASVQQEPMSVSGSSGKTTPPPPGTPATGAPPPKAMTRPKPPPKPSAEGAPDPDAVAHDHHVGDSRAINPETGLPCGKQPAPPTTPPPPSRHTPTAPINMELASDDSVVQPAPGETQAADVSESSKPVSPKGRKPPSEPPAPLPDEIGIAPKAPPEDKAARPVIEEVVGEKDDVPQPRPFLAEPETLPSDAQQLDNEEALARTKKRLKRGRLHVTLVGAKNVHKKAQVTVATNINPYVKATVGTQQDAPTLKSTVLKGCGTTVDFRKEVLDVDIAEPTAHLADNDVKLLVELWDQGAWQDDILGRGELSVLPFMDKPGSKFDFPLTLLYPGDKTSNMELNLLMHFEQAKPGMAVFTLYEAKNLSTGGRLDNFVTLSLGDKYTKRSKNVKEGKTNPWFKEEQVVMWVSATNWTDDVTLRVYDYDGANDELIGQQKFSILPYMGMTPSTFAPQSFALKKRQLGEELDAGEMVVKVEFLVAGTLSVTVVEGKRLRKTNKAVGRQDPYVVFKVDGAAVTMTRKTRVDKDGGSDPVWNETIMLDIVDQYLLEVEVWDQDVRAKDEMIGKGSYSLLSVFKRGYVDTWVVVKRQGEDGQPEESGDVHLVFDFQGPPGVAYPQHQPNVDSYDERDRTNLSDDGRSKMATSKLQAVRKTAQKQDKHRSYEFTDDEIMEAFKFIDLDKNNFIGAAEIRHILVCMGELVTDEEIDAMVTLVDGDGDGQVAYKEFYRMVVHPNLAQYDCKAARDDPDEEKKTDYDRQKEMMEREEKKKLFQVLSEDNTLGPAETRKIFDRFRGMPASMLQKGTDFDLFCSVLGVLPTGQYSKLFQLYDRTGGGFIDMREFLLGLFNFVNLDKEERVGLIFKLFDVDRSGFLSEDEIRDSLKATHMQSDKGVEAKLQTLMKQVKSPDRTLSFEEFKVISQKLPNLLFPPRLAGEDEKAPQSQQQHQQPKKVPVAM